MGAERPSPEQEPEEDERHHKPLLIPNQLTQRETTHIPIATSAARPRPQRDTLFAALFVTTLLATYTIGFVAVRNADDAQPESKLRFARFNPESNQCERIQHAYVGTTPTHVALTPSRKALTPERKAYETGHHMYFATLLAPVLLTAALILPLGLTLLYLLHRYTREALFAIVALMCIVPLSFLLIASTICFTSKTCSTMSTTAQFTSTFLSFTGLLTFVQFLVVCKNLNRLDLTVQILKTSLQSLKQNLSLLLLNPVLGFATVAINAPIGVFMYYAFLNGRVAPNFVAVRDTTNGCSLATGAPCCEFQRSNWVTPYLVLASAAMLWVVLVTGQVQILVVSGTVSQWYFSGSANMKRAIRNAFGPSFGTACLSSLMLTSSLLDRAVLKNPKPGIFAVFLRACFGWLFQLFEFFTRFTTNFAAISGLGFCAAAQATSELLRQNWLSTLVVEVLVQYLLTGMALSFAMLHFGVVFAIMHFFEGEEPFMAASLCFVVSFLGLGQLCQALAAMIDTVYICYAMDKDVGVVSKAEVHDVYMLLPPASGDETMLAVRSFEP